MSITAAPTLTVAGATIARAVAETGAASLVAVDALRVTWGRAGVLEAPQPASASLTVLDRSAGFTFASRTDLIGQVVVLGWSGSDASTGTLFRGRITAVSATPRPAGGFLVALAATSVEVDLANYTVPAGTTWPAETFTARATRIAALFPAGSFTGGINLPHNADLGLVNTAVPGTDITGDTAAQQDASGKSALDLLRQLYASLSPLAMVYDPAADRFTFAPRRRTAYAGSLIAAGMLAADPDHGGRYVAATSGSRVHLDAGQLEYSGALSQALDARITRVEVSYLDSSVSYAQRSRSWGTVNIGDESVIGRRVLSVDSIQSTVAKADQIASLYADVASVEARTPRLGAVGWSATRESLHDATHAARLLSCAEQAGSIFLGRSWLPRLGQRPIVGVLGGQVSYAAGDWTAQLNPAPTFIDPQPFAWAPMPVSASAVDSTVRLADLDESVTFGDAGFIEVGAGFTAGSTPAYPGNPT